MILLILNYHMYFLDKISLMNDAPRPWGLYFQDSASPQMEALIELHDNIMFYLAIILFGVAWVMTSIIRNFVFNKSPISNKYLNHGTLIELIWTVTPALILILIAFPSFKLLYLMDEVTDPSLTIFVEGHQWYWSYQYPDFLSDDNEGLEFDSYLVPEWDLEEGALRLLEDVLFSSHEQVVNTNHNPQTQVDSGPVNEIDLHIFEADGTCWLADRNDRRGIKLSQLAGNNYHVRTVENNYSFTAAIKGFIWDNTSVNFTLSTANVNRFRNIITSQDSKILNAVYDMRMGGDTSKLNVRLAG